jgi:hypothetical protein
MNEAQRIKDAERETDGGEPRHRLIEEGVVIILQSLGEEHLL